MNMSNQITFNISLGIKKPESIVNKETICPFCDEQQLENIIETDGPIIWLKNKFPVLNQTYQTVIIETDQCNSDISNYSKDHLVRLFHFAIQKWLDLEHDEQFKSVLLFKNHGHLSGGTIKHPHMQIIGLKDINYLDDVEVKNFEGILIDMNGSVEWNLSKYPRMGFYEWNIIMKNLNEIDIMAGYIQKCVYYLLNHFSFHCDSYNLFFYHFNGMIIAKITPRFVVSPLFVGYSIRQVANNIEDIVMDIRNHLLAK